MSPSLSIGFAAGSAQFWEFPDSGLTLTFSLIVDRYHRMSCCRRRLECVVLLLELIPLEGPRRWRIVDGLVATSSFDSR